MKPNKLYIPTTTLNFNNIMACESISPAGFYSVRGFGYKRFDKVSPNNLDKRIILYEKYPIFSINDKELESYPLVIELDTETIEEGIIQEYKSGVYYSEETIYLNPLSTQFIFNNEKEKRSTLSKVEQSLNTKMTAIYQNCIIAKTPDFEEFEWKAIDLEDSKNDLLKHISKDKKINKLKGLLYAYLLGANKSLSPTIVALKKYAKELENVLSAIITSPDSRVTHKQEESLRKLYVSINKAFYEIDQRLQCIIKQKKEQYKCENFIDIFRSEDVLDYWFQKQNIKPQFQIPQFYVSHSSSPDEKQKILDEYISNLTNVINEIAISRNIKIEDLPKIQHCSKVEDIPNQKEFLSRLLNEYLIENWNSEEFISSRLEFATVGGKLFKEELQDKWENSSYKNYINGLRNNLVSHTSFFLNDTENQTLKSFAAFCQKGEDDIDKLVDYLISNEIGDFRIAFALWGAIFGFANMPKTLTNDLFLSNDLDYISDIYKYVFKQIHDIDLKGKLERTREKEVVAVPSKPNEETKGIETKQQASEVEIREKLKQIKIRANQIDTIIEIWKNNDSLVNDKLFALISKAKGIGKATVDKIKIVLQPEQASKVADTLPLFQNDIKADKEFYKDTNVFGLIENLLPTDKKTQKEFKIDLDWFQDEYKKGDSSEYYKNAKRDNDTAIEAFYRYITKKKYATKMNVKLIVSKLKELYL